MVTSISNYKTQKLKNEHDIAMAKLEKEAMIAEAEIGIKVTEAEVQGELAKADADIFKESIKVGNERIVESKTINKLLDGNRTKWVGTFIVFLLGIAEAFKSIMRPALTVYLVAVTSWITYSSIQLLQAKQALITAATAAALFSNITNIVIFLAVSAVTWWFGNRGVEKYMQQMKK